ncbi:unnamed protein product, partial [Mesorhabditis spiculigera]
MLLAGTLLGWRRECGFITHTPDMDVGYFEPEYPYRMVDNIIDTGNETFGISRILGRADYGDDWQRVVMSRNFSWNRGPKNVVKIGVISPEERAAWIRKYR